MEIVDGLITKKRRLGMALEDLELFKRSFYMYIPYGLVLVCGLHVCRRTLLTNEHGINQVFIIPAFTVLKRADLYLVQTLFICSSL